LSLSCEKKQKIFGHLVQKMLDFSAEIAGREWQKLHNDRQPGTEHSAVTG